MQEREGDRRCFFQPAPIGATGAQSCKETMNWYTTLDSESPVHPHSPLTEGKEAGIFAHQLQWVEAWVSRWLYWRKAFPGSGKKTKCLRPSEFIREQWKVQEIWAGPDGVCSRDLSYHWAKEKDCWFDKFWDWPTCLEVEKLELGWLLLPWLLWMETLRAE